MNAVINTIGFPLVGGPAGSMEAGRQQDVAQAILTTKNIPYIIGAPLLVQDLESWMRDGIAGDKAPSCSSFGSVSVHHLLHLFYLAQLC